MGKDNIGEIRAYYSSQLADIFRKYDIKPKEEPRKEEPVAEQTQPLEEVIEKIQLERWTVFSFTLPVKITKRIAFGFESKDAGKDFINQHLVKRDDTGNVIQKTLHIDGVDYNINYDVIRESTEEIDVYANDPELTTVGNNREDVLRRWLD